MKRVALFAAFALLASVSTSVPAEKAKSSDILELLEASLTAGEGVPAQVLLRQYLAEYPRTSRVAELEVLADFYSGNYEAAANEIAELRKQPGGAAELGSLADVII
ncbi:MAG: hypothetical protein WBM74_09090, partial [Polyangiales bacterium]